MANSYIQESFSRLRAQKDADYFTKIYNVLESYKEKRKLRDLLDKILPNMTNLNKFNLYSVLCLITQFLYTVQGEWLEKF